MNYLLDANVLVAWGWADHTEHLRLGLWIAAARNQRGIDPGRGDTTTGILPVARWLQIPRLIGGALHDGKNGNDPSHLSS